METETEVSRIDNSRPLATRIPFAVLWSIIIYVVVLAVIGGLVGLLSGPSAGSVEDSYAAAEAASIAFIERYVLVVVLSVIVLVVTLSWYGMLPGTGKYKGVRYRDRWEALPTPLRAVISLLIVVFIGGLWGVFTVVVGVPQILSTVGLVVIVAGVIAHLSWGSK